MIRPIWFALAATLGIAAPAAAQTPRFEIGVDPAVHQGPLTGRLIVILTRSAQPEPRLTFSPLGPAMFGVDLEQLAPGRAAVVDQSALGYPMAMSALPAGEYYAQALVNVYTQVKRSDGHTIWVRINDGTQDVMPIAAGNLYSGVEKVTIGAGGGGTIRLTLDKLIAREKDPPDTEWIKRVRIQSQKLSAFWGRPIFVHATVLLPRGYAQHADTRYPAIYTLGHEVPFSFSLDSARARNVGQISPVTGLESGFDFSKSWRSDGFPRVIAISFAQQTPYFPDSYSVNSANNGPYGDAIVEEIMPELERQFRIIPKPYARIVEGASTGGWQTLALQLQHPDYFGGAWIFQPDPIDFHRYQQIDIYSDTNAFVVQGSPLMTEERIFQRTVEGMPRLTIRQLSRFEEVLGTRGRSAFQLGAWEAVYGPVGADGYPKPLWNKLTGTIDHEVAEYMRAHGFDLRDYTERNWAVLGPKLAGKLHFSAGDMDDFYLNLAVYRMEDFLRNATNPASDAEFTYGRPMKGHAWHKYTWADLVRQIADHVAQHAPAGEDPTRWRY